jgi:hypothetical protein
MRIFQMTIFQYIGRSVMALLLVLGVLFFNVSECNFNASAIAQNQSQSQPTVTVVEAGSMFESVKQQLRLPALLPTQLPSYGQQPLESTVSSSATNTYVIRIHNKGCNAGACSYGSLSATRVSADSPSLDSIIQQYQADSTRAERRSPDSAGEVTLKGDRTGYFFPWYGTGNVNEAFVLYEQDGIRYTFGIKGGSKENVLTLTNSAL